jgi:hypothetical protein
MRQKNSSRDQLVRSSDRRIKHLMIQTLESFEDAFPDIDSTRDGEIFKAGLRTAFNDVMRAQRDELHDYEVEYRPLKLTNDNTLAVTRTFMQTVQKIEFGIDNQPYMRICVSEEHANVLDAIRAEFGAGVLYDTTDTLYQSDKQVVLEIVGVLSCVDRVLPRMDKYRLHPDVRKNYLRWRTEVVELYRNNG